MAVSVLDVVAAQIEKVEPILGFISESSAEIAGMIKRGGGKNITISRYGYRLPLQAYKGGNFHKINADGGSMGIGTGMSIISLQSGFFTFARSYRVTDEERNTTASREQAIVNVFQRTLADAMSESNVDDDIVLHGDGTGILTNQSSATTSTTMTFNATGDNLGINRLREGMTVDVWDSAGANKRAPSSGTAPTVITAIDFTNKIVTLSQSIAAITSTDILALPALDIYGPTTLTSFSSTWPGGGLTNGPGLTGDSSRHGIYYSNDTNTSNYYLGKLKSTVPQLLATRVNGGGNQITFAMILQGWDAVLQRRDKEATRNLTAIVHMKQRQQVFQLQVNVSNRVFGWGGDKMQDFMPSNTGYTDSFDMCGIPARISKRQFGDRIDVINPKLWQRTQQYETRFKEVGGNKVFPVRMSDGTLATSQEFHIESAFDFVNADPGVGFYVDTLAVPS